MKRKLTINYEKSNEDIPVLCVLVDNLFNTEIIRTFTGLEAEQLFNKLTGKDVVVKVEMEGNK